MDDEVGIPLANAIRSLRRELVAAVQEGQDEKVRFALGPIELELQVEITREAGGDAKIGFWVVAFGGSAGRATGSSHTVRLSLNPVLASESGDVPLVVGSDEVTRPR